MKILITGVCGFVGSTLAETLLGQTSRHEILGLDNFIRPGSENNRARLKKLGVRMVHADLRAASDIDTLPSADWVIDAAANPSVLAGVDGMTSSRQLVEHNLSGTINLLEYCRRNNAGFTLLSTSRVYSIHGLSKIPVSAENEAFRITPGSELPFGLTANGLDENFPTSAPISLYGSTKLASEVLALEYGETFKFPVYVNRCGVLAGAGQFGRPDQGIFAYWINSWANKRPLKYIGFGGHGHQVRDCLHPRDLLPLLEKQFTASGVRSDERTLNLSGGILSATSLRQLSQWCEERYGKHEVKSDASPRSFDIPWLVLDFNKASELWGWCPVTPTTTILTEIAEHADKNPDWLDLSAPL